MSRTKRKTPQTIYRFEGTWLFQDELPANCNPVTYSYRRYGHESDRLRSYFLGGVGKKIKVDRHRRHRRNVRGVIRGRIIQGDLDVEVPVEKNRDRWEFW